KSYTASRTPNLSSTLNALGANCNPAPTSLNSGACSNTWISFPKRARPRAVESPPIPPPIIKIDAFFVFDNILHPLYKIIFLLIMEVSVERHSLFSDEHHLLDNTPAVQNQRLSL